MSEFETRPVGQEPDELELKLMQAMRRVDAPEGFAASLMERAATPAAQRVIVMRPRRVWWSRVVLAVAAALVVCVFFVERVHQQHVREAEATQQFETATRITDATLQHTRERLARAGISLEQ